MQRLDDPDTNVRFHAIEALGKLAPASAVERLAAIAESNDFFLAFPALDALARISDPRWRRASCRCCRTRCVGEQAAEVARTDRRRRRGRAAGTRARPRRRRRSKPSRTRSSAIRQRYKDELGVAGHIERSGAPADLGGGRAARSIDVAGADGRRVAEEPRHRARLAARRGGRARADASARRVGGPPGADRGDRPVRVADGRSVDRAAAAAAIRRRGGPRSSRSATLATRARFRRLIDVVRARRSRAAGAGRRRAGAARRRARVRAAGRSCSATTSWRCATRRSAALNSIGHSGMAARMRAAARRARRAAPRIGGEDRRLFRLSRVRRRRCSRGAATRTKRFAPPRSSTSRFSKTIASLPLLVDALSATRRAPAPPPRRRSRTSRRPPSRRSSAARCEDADSWVRYFAAEQPRDARRISRRCRCSSAPPPATNSSTCASPRRGASARSAATMRRRDLGRLADTASRRSRARRSSALGQTGSPRPSSR